MKFGVFYQLPWAAEPSVAGRCQDALGQIQSGFPDFQIQEEI